MNHYPNAFIFDSLLDDLVLGFLLTLNIFNVLQLFCVINTPKYSYFIQICLKDIML